jgi:glycosyltransferase involved in cell wall biosynthesis
MVVSNLAARKPIIIVTLLSERGKTGVQAHFSALRTWLQEKGELVSVVTPFQSYRVVAYPLFAIRRLIDQFSGSSSVWWYRYWHYLFLKISIFRLLKVQSSAVIYAQCPVSAKAALEVRVSKQHRVVMIAHFNVSQADEWAEKGKIRPGGWMFRKIRKLEDEILPQLDGIVYVSQFIKKNLEDRIAGLRRVESQVIPNFCAVPSEDTQADVRGDLINIGTLEPRKNQQYLLAVLAKAKRRGFRYKLTMIGDGPDRKSLEQLARELNIEEDVKFLGGELNAARFISGHRVYVHSSTMETFGIVLIEAMAVGRPLLAAPVGGIPEVFSDGVEGFYWRLDDPEYGATRLISLLEDNQLFQRLSSAALQRYRSAFSEELIGGCLYKFLN